MMKAVGSQAASERHAGCAACVEQNKGCTCGGGVGLHHHEEKADSSFLHSVINMVGMMIGLGQLSTPYALENGGWASVFLLVGLGAACAYSSHVIGKCLQLSPKSRDYQDVGEQAFGRAGRLAAATFVYLEIFLCLVSYTISLNDNLALAFPAPAFQLPTCLSSLLSPKQLLTVAAVLLALPSLWLRDLSSISVLSFAGIILSFLIFTSVFCTALFGDVMANHTMPALNLPKIPGISGLYVFGYTGHIVFPNIYKAMKDPSHFTRVSMTSFSIVISLYVGLAFMGAKLFGPSVKPQITLSMPPNKAYTKLAIWATVLTPMSKYALEFAPFAMKLEHSLPQSMNSRSRLLVRGGVGSALLLVILALAFAVPYFEHVLALTGSLLSTSICVVFPCAFYMRICREDMSAATFALNGVLVAVGIALGLLGTVSSFDSLVRSMQGHY